MRSCLIAAVLTLLAAVPALADDAAGPAHDGAALVSLDCCHRIELACLTLKHAPRCTPVCHRCATPYDICHEPCILEVCHREPAFFDPCVEIRPRCVCHRPATVVLPEDECECELELSGDRDLIPE
jgi:hypothetical protein